MKKLAIFLLLPLVGCSMLDIQEKGERTTTYYDLSGKPTHTVTENVMVGDKYTEYTDAAKSIAEASERVETARIDGILTATAPQPGDSEAVIAWKGAAATLSIAQVGGNAEKAIGALYYGKDRYDNANTAIGVGGNVATAGVVTYGVKKVMDRAFDASGDRMSVTGDSNQVSYEKQELRNEIHAQTTGDNSPPNINVDSKNKPTENAPPPAEEPAGEEVVEGEWYNGIVGCSSQESFDAGLCGE